MKHVGPGEIVGKGAEYKDGGKEAVKYTCVGCSGGLVLRIGANQSNYLYGTIYYPHSGATESLEVGISANWRDHEHFPSLCNINLFFHNPYH